MKLHFKFLFPLLLCNFLFFSCVTTASFKGEFVSEPQVFPVNELCPPEIKWTSLQEGFAITSHRIPKIGVTWHCVKIDLSTPNLFIDIEPKQNHLGETFSVKEFSKITDAIVAINTTPFDLDGKTYLPVGIIKANNKIIWEPKEKYCALVLKKDSSGFKAEILDNQIQSEIDEFDYAIGGFYTIYEDEQILPFKKNKRSRTGCGISHDGKFLYLMVTTPDFHLRDRNGLNYEECALIFRNLGCTKAMQFDGGHSSAMIVNGKAVETPFLQRKVPTALSISIK